MGFVRCKSSDPWQLEAETSGNAFEHVGDDNESGIREAWAEISVSTRRSFGSGDGSWKKLERKKSQVLLEGYVETLATMDNRDDLTRSKSLTDDDLEDLKGCLDLGFGFSYDEIPELCNTLPALELCYSMSQKFLDDKQNSSRSSPEGSPVEDSPLLSPATATPIANWKISSPGDNPDDVKARLKYWAQAVACTVQLCS
ncbi:unnamed protein product [Microthlaspi erraticum]|uniref:Uncharacterized protein n=1 Tax=Microthlaspi erraticum TaxID=1685480 RepID=A0A6D2ILD7_9BRAS|nr:unnamed protein product [Microthlaspi erraticum]